MQITCMRACHMENPLGISEKNVTLSYTIEDSIGKHQTAARIRLSTDPTTTGVCYDTGWVENEYDPSTGRLIKGIDALMWQVSMPLFPRTRYLWQVCVRTDAGEEACSEWSSFETAKAIGEAWQGIFIGSPFGRAVHPVFRKTFIVKKNAVSGRMYCLGLGAYEAILNGMKLGDEVILPGLHTYDKCLQYQTFELPIQSEENTIEFLLGEGWYMGRYGLKASTPRYGTDYALIAEMRIHYADGSEDVIATDESWLVHPSCVISDGIYDGEVVDANLSSQTQNAFAAVPVKQPDKSLLMARLSPPLKVQERLTATLTEPEGNILDFGQNMAGWVAFRCGAPKGTKICLRYGELIRDGHVYRGNLRSAKCEFTYIADGQVRMVCPHFSYFGFRYVEVEGFDTPLNPADFTACVIYSQMERRGWIETSDEKLNRLFENQLWSQKSNFLDVPTDCPQRDERMGWTGDIQIFSDTACFNMDCFRFLQKFLHDLSCDQESLGGAVPCVTPMAGYRLPGVAAWGDAATIIPWNIFLHSGDKSILREQLPSMKRWVDYIHGETKKDGTGFLWTKTAQLGDWLALDGNSVYGATDRGLIATAYYFLSALLTSKAAQVLGNVEDTDAYYKLAQNIKEAFQNEFVTPSGRLAAETQTACSLCLQFGLLPESAKKCTAEFLRRKVIEAGEKLETGFVGTGCLLPALCENGSADIAYSLLLRQNFPGWLYEVNMGATTIWERWNSIEPDHTMNRDGMNSLNHYAYGAVAGWMYRTMGGISPVEDAPGFRGIHIQPVPDPRIKWCHTKLNTGLGLCETRWEWCGGTRLKLEITVPFDTVVTVTLPGKGEIRRLEAGHAEFILDIDPPAPRGIDSPWVELLTNKATRSVVERLFPRAIRGVAFQNEMYTMRQVVLSPFAELDRDQIEAFDAALKQAQTVNQSDV